MCSSYTKDRDKKLNSFDLSVVLWPIGPAVAELTSEVIRQELF